MVGEALKAPEDPCDILSRRQSSIAITIEGYHLEGCVVVLLWVARKRDATLGWWEGKE